MAQLRLMTDDRELGERVLELLLPVLQDAETLLVSEPTRLNHRAGGLRVVLDVQPADAGRGGRGR